MSKSSHETHSESGSKSNNKTTRRRGPRMVWGGLCVLVGTASAWWFLPDEADLSIRPTKVQQVAGKSTLVDGTEIQDFQDILQMARDCYQQMQTSIDDYSARIVKQERVGGRLLPKEEMEVKIRTRRAAQDGSIIRPMNVYIRFIQPESAQGREIIWGEAFNDGKLLVHEAGLKNWLRVSLAPTGFFAMRGNRYPITEIGLMKLVEQLIQRGERQQDDASDRTTVKVLEDYKVGDRPCTLIQIKNSKPNHKNDDFSLAEIAFDNERRIPLRYTAFGWPDEKSTSHFEDQPLLESYTYLDVKLNIGLTDIDFDPDNPDYDYP